MTDTYKHTELVTCLHMFCVCRLTKEGYFVRGEKDIPVCATYFVRWVIQTKIIELTYSKKVPGVSMEDAVRNIINNYLEKQ